MRTSMSSTRARRSKTWTIRRTTMRSRAPGERARAEASSGRAALGRRGLLGGALALALLALGSWHGLRAEPSADAARTLIQTVGDEVLTVLRDASLGDQDKVERLVALLNGPIDLDLVARLILGRHWRSASEEQRAEYLELFRAFALHTLASRLDVYGGQEFEITGAKVVGR